MSTATILDFSIMRKIRYWWENLYPAVWAVAGTFVIYYYRQSFSLSDFISENTATLLSTGVTLVGFFLTVMTVIKSIDSRAMKALRAAGHEPRLISFLKSAIIFNVIACAFILIFQLSDMSSRELIKMEAFDWASKKTFSIMVIAALFFSWTYSFRFIRILIRFMT